jgi:hypothetical protein
MTVALLVLTSTAVLAQDQQKEKEGVMNSPWRFKAVVYGWLPSAPVKIFRDGEQVGELPESLDTILDSLDFTLMFELEAHKGPLGFYLSPVYYKGTFNKDFEGPLGQPNTFTLKEKAWLVDYGVGWDIPSWKLGEGADASTLTVTPFIGFRYFRDKITTRVKPGPGGEPLESVTTPSFNTPVVGVKAAVKFDERWTLAVAGDWGVWDDDLVNDTYQYLGAVSYNYLIKEKVPARVLLGYRFVHLDLENDINGVGIEVDIKGPFIGFGVNF